MKLLDRLLGRNTETQTETQKVSIKVSGRTHDGMQFEGQTDDCTGSNESELAVSCAVEVKEKTGKLLQSVTIIECSDRSIVRTGQAINLDRNGEIVTVDLTDEDYDDEEDYEDEDYDDEVEFGL